MVTQSPVGPSHLDFGFFFGSGFGQPSWGLGLFIACRIASFQSAPSARMVSGLGPVAAFFDEALGIRVALLE